MYRVLSKGQGRQRLALLVGTQQRDPMNLPGGACFTQAVFQNSSPNASHVGYRVLEGCGMAITIYIKGSFNINLQ